MTKHTSSVRCTDCQFAVAGNCKCEIPFPPAKITRQLRKCSFFRSTLAARRRAKSEQKNFVKTARRRIKAAGLANHVIEIIDYQGVPAIRLTKGASHEIKVAVGKAIRPSV